jgi:uncharacterized protein
MGSRIKGAQFSLLIKPAGADCNLRCGYCFYLDRCRLYPHSRRMPDPVLRRLVASYMATDQATYTFGWQGGEPTLMGTAFFRRVVELQKEYGRDGAPVANGLQTNATRVTTELAALLARYRFLVGVSLDGSPEVHDVHRRFPDGRGSQARVLEGLAMLSRAGVETNILSAVSSASAGRGAEIYRYLLDRGARYHQYIPIVEFDARGEPLPCTIKPQDWGEFLCRIFDIWISEHTTTVSVRLFDAILALLVDGTRTTCTMAADCRQYFLVEHNGDIYPCDFFVEEKELLGNIMESGWEDLLASPRYLAFGSRKSVLNPACSGCPYLEFCAGDCQKLRYRCSRDPAQLSWLCRGWQIFYEHALPALKRLARTIKARRQAPAAPALPVQPGPEAAGAYRAGRNDPCPCGSGRKYKHCHGR